MQMNSGIVGVAPHFTATHLIAESRPRSSQAPLSILRLAPSCTPDAALASGQVQRVTRSFCISVASAGLVAVSLTSRQLKQRFRRRRRGCNFISPTARSAFRRRAPPPNKEPVTEDDFVDMGQEHDDADFDIADVVGKDVVKVFVTTSSPSHVRPWTKRPQSSSSGSAFPISGKRLLTNAHVVKDSTVVRVRRRGEYRKYIARVERICHMRDLALLAVDDETFWTDLEPIELDTNLPEPQDDVRVIGYAGDSDNICITRGVVSRVDMLWYTHDVQLLAMQIDAAINPGNSGGPVIGENGLCVGVAFEKNVQADVDNVGYVIPNEVVQHFLAGEEVGYAGLQFQPLESIAARSSCGLPLDESRGIRVRYVDPATPAYGLVRVGDVVLAVDGVDVGCDGTIPLSDDRPGERVSLSYLTTRQHRGGIMKFLIWRQVDAKDGNAEEKSGSAGDDGAIGQQVEVSIELADPGTLVPTNPEFPEYLLVGGLVFVPLTETYLEDAYGSDWPRMAPPFFVYLYDDGRRQAKGAQAIVLAHVLCAGGDEDSEDLMGSVGQIVETVNGEKVLNLRGLADAVARKDRGRWLRFGLEGGDVVVLDGELVEEQQKQVMNVHRISEPMQLYDDVSSRAVAVA